MFTFIESRDRMSALDRMARNKIENFPRRTQEVAERIKAGTVGKYDIGNLSVFYDECEAAKEIRESIALFLKEEVIDPQKAMDNFLDRMDYGMRYAHQMQQSIAKMSYYMDMNHFIRGGIPIN